MSYSGVSSESDTSALCSRDSVDSRDVPLEAYPMVREVSSLALVICWKSISLIRTLRFLILEPISRDLIMGKDFGYLYSYLKSVFKDYTLIIISKEF